MNILFPINKQDFLETHWTQADFIIVSGDAFVDHSSFGAAIIARVLKKFGYRVCIIAQPDWHDESAFEIYGKPRLAFLVTSGNMDSMVCHYTVNKKRRSEDAYTPGNQSGSRPDRALIVYCNKIREAFGKVPIIIGGVEASLRRFAHYDYWQNKVRRPILCDCGADLLVYGMGEKAILEVAEALDAGLSIQDVGYIRGTGVLTHSSPEEGIKCPSYELVSSDKKAFAKAASVIYRSNNPYNDNVFVQECEGRWFVQNPPQMPLSTMEMDDVYDLPYSGHQLSPGEEITCLDEVRFSITSNRGCFGNCSFCAIGIHQGRIVQRRSEESILNEAKKMTGLSNFKGYINDVGGPTANFLNPACSKQKNEGPCSNRECLFPKPCPNLEIDESDYCNILKKMRLLKGVKKVFVRSGIRYDYLLNDKKSNLFEELVKYHVSGQLRVAPEHLSDPVLHLMGKPHFSVYEQFIKKFNILSKRYGKKQYVVPYFISGHPGTRLEDALKLSEYFRDHHVIPEQVQDFYPTPGSLATAMYYTGLNPLTMETVHVPKDREKQMQRALLQYNHPQNYQLVREALELCDRQDLIGDGPHAIIKDRSKKKRRCHHHQKSGR
ncbi:MAG: YgiQ family radical SAM protein [Eubacteriaceae bacterium]|nr:YgiQ family radical SAM protein [Eubacteriaceae bacterium]